MITRIRFLKKYFFDNKRQFVISFGILILLSIISVVPNLFLKRIFDYGLPNKDMMTIVVPALLMLALYMIKSLLNYKSLFILNKWSQEIVAHIRNDVTGKLMRLPMAFYDLNDPSYVAARVTEVNHLLGLFSQSTIKTVIGIFEFVGVLIVLLNINSYLTALLLLMSPLFVMVSYNYAKALNKTSTMVLENNSRLDSRVQHSFKNIEEIKNLSVEKEEQEQLKNENSKLLKSSIEQSNTIVKSTEILTFLSSFTMVVLIITGGIFIIKLNLTIGEYMVFSSLAAKLFAPMQSFSMLSITLRPGFAALDRINAFMNEKIDLSDEREVDKLRLDSINKIQFNTVFFRYRSSTEPIIKGLSFTISGADKVCIKGANGSGKTTIFRLLLALYDVQDGEITLNDNPLNNYRKKDIRNRMSIVSQKIKLFPGTIEDNIRYGSNISDDAYRLKTSDEKFQLILRNLPNNIMISDGDNLSGGQIQRIAIARGLIRDVDLFLFDEATSNLDKEGAKSLMALVSNLLGDKMCIFIEHNDCVDSICDKQIVL